MLGVINELPVPLLIGQNWPGFQCALYQAQPEEAIDAAAAALVAKNRDLSPPWKDDGHVELPPEGHNQATLRSHWNHHPGTPPTPRVPGAETKDSALEAGTKGKSTKTSDRLLCVYQQVR